VDLSYSAPIGGPASVTASATTAVVLATFTPPPMGDEPQSVIVTATGRTHHLSVSVTVGFALPILLAGQTATNQLWGLATPTLGYSLSIQGNGVIIDKWRTDPSGPIPSNTWNSPPLHGSASDTGRLVMQTDGNLVLYGPNGANWATGTNGTGSHNYALLQTNGNLVVYNSSNKALWSSAVGRIWPSKLTTGQELSVTNRLADGRFSAYINSLGDFVVAGVHTWHTPAAGAGAHLLMQTNGNVVLYNHLGHSVWSSGTANKGGVTLLLQSDGNLVLYNSAGHSVWATHTN